jgi:Zn-dependent alcohol dehydrogenase
MGLMPDGTTRLRKGDIELKPMVGVGSFAEYLVALEGALIKVREDAPLETVCLIGCGVTTGVGAALNTAAVKPGSTVAVVGCGGVGLNVVQGARLAGAAKIIAVDINPKKLPLAAEFGATHQVRSGERDAVAQVQAIVPGGVDYAFEVIGNPATVAQAFEMSRPGGTTVMVGSPPPGSQIAVDGRLLFAERKLMGCTYGSSRPIVDMPRLVDFYLDGRLKLDELITQRVPLDQVNEALHALETGDVARTVIML